MFNIHRSMRLAPIAAIVIGIAAIGTIGAHANAKSLPNGPIESTESTERPSASHARSAQRPEAALVTGTPRQVEWLTGSMFTGALTHDQARAPMPIQVVGFRGDHVLAFVHRDPSGWRFQTFHARELVGLEWMEYRCDMGPHCPALTHRIVEAHRDESQNTMPAHSDNQDIWLYRVQSRPVGAGADVSWRDACGSPTEEGGRGLFVDGQWRSDGSWAANGYTFSCTGGVIAKCARTWGYKPWRTLMAHDGRAVALGPLHRACVRAARADYCGDGISYTRNGTMIDISDTYRFNVPGSMDGFAEEAGFDAHGALFVRHERWPTGTRDTENEIVLPTCRRPRTTLDARSERVLMIVRSAKRYTVSP